MERELLIVGVDPGTTIGYAIISLDKRIIVLNSSRLLNQNKLAKIIIDTGQPVIIAADKCPIPGLVGKLATKLGARIMGPKVDMLVSYKKQLTEGLGTKNDHERDALAAALSAHKRVFSLLNRIDNYVHKEKKQHILYDLRRMLLTSDSISIRATSKFLETGHAKEKQEIIKKIAENRDFKKDYFRLYEQYRRLLDELNLVRLQRDRLKTLKNQTIIKKHSTRKQQNQLMQKDRQIRSLYSKIDIQAKQLKKDSVEFRHMIEILKHLEKYSTVRIIDDLGIKYANIMLNDEVLFVRDPTIASQKTIKNLKTKVNWVISGKKSRFLDDFILIDSKNINIMEFGNIGVVKKNDLVRAMKQKNILKDIVRQYRKSR